MEFDLTTEFLWELFLSQNKKCALSGVALKLEPFKYSRSCKTQTASIDRINSTKGYTKENVQWVHKILNEMKSSTPNDEFINWCKLIASNN